MNHFHRSSTGYLELVIGPMMSGKTTEALMFATSKSAHYKVLYIDYIDANNRVTKGGGTDLSTHNQALTVIPSNIDRVRTERLSSVDVSSYQVIVVDESNFYPDLLSVVDQWVNQEGKHLLVVGLDGNYRQQPFGQILDLIPICDSVRKINSECSACIEDIKQEGYQPVGSYPAPFTKRLGTSTQVKLIGGSESYQSVCRKHLS